MPKIVRRADRRVEGVRQQHFQKPYLAWAAVYGPQSANPHPRSRHITPLRQRQDHRRMHRFGAHLVHLLGSQLPLRLLHAETLGGPRQLQENDEDNTALKIPAGHLYVSLLSGVTQNHTRDDFLL